MYRIRDWDSHFENNKSRERDQCSYICLPNKHGLGKRHLLRMPNGANHFSIFVLLAQACSRQKRPRLGYLTDTGRADGRPLDLEDMAALTEQTPSHVRDAMKALTSDKVSWIEDLPSECLSSAREVPAECPLKEGKGIEEKGIEGAASADAEVGGKVTPANGSIHNALIAFFVSEWGKRHNGAKYDFARGKDNAAAGRIRKACSEDLERVQRIISAYLADSDPWIKKRGHTLAILASQLNSYLPAESKREKEVDNGNPIKMRILNKRAADSTNAPSTKA